VPQLRQPDSAALAPRVDPALFAPRIEGKSMFGAWRASPLW
jgi:hypothetical protein